MFKKPKSVLRRVVNMLLAAVLMLAGPALMITSYQQVDADEELARTGVHVTGTITYFSDARKASNRDITVEYVAADGVNRYANAPVDHEQHPSVGGQVTVSYRQQSPDQAVVLGYGSNSEFLGGCRPDLDGSFYNVWPRPLRFRVAEAATGHCQWRLRA